ncbi:MAG TPA: LysM domain-containing protein [Candidatus Limnocylindrales bacterium]|nr:LysM domain-containing protein [Candidatus Limnocylindrales bacterium]
MATVVSAAATILPTREATNTPEPSSTPRPSNTPLPTDTSTARPSRTPRPTDTSTPRPTRTPRPTNTPTQTPTATFTATSTRTPSATATYTSTATATFTSTFTHTPTATATFTPTFTRTPTATPTQPLPTAIVLPEDAVLPTIEVFTSPNSSVTCIAPPGWVRYTILPGETLFEIARATGTTVGVLRAANCLNDANVIISGSVIFVPRPVSGFVPTVAPVFPMVAPLGSTPEALDPEGCGAPSVQISSPEAGDEVTSVFALIGSANAPGFRYYEIDVRPEGVETYDFYLRRSQPVTDGPLAAMNTGLFGEGLHWVRVRVIDQAGNTLEPCAIPLIFR